MCGIAGAVGSDNLQAMEDGVRTMVGTLARRGPDDEGIEKWTNVVLGHRRLSIFDLSSAGHQPMVTPDRSVGVVFNGSIYNYRTLRRELIAAGCTFKSNTDTEVLLHGYRHWGLDQLVSKLQGMFAFGLWDERLHKLYLVRDRLGVKPLVFSTSGRRLAFASTVRALKAAGYVGQLNPNAVLDFLHWGFISDELCVYENVDKVPASGIVEWSDGSWQLRTYWAPPETKAAAKISFDEAVEEAERLLLSAVESRLHADVPVESLLSGGIDSSLVCWAVSKLGANITAYTIGTPGDPWDETKHAQETARSLKLEHRVLEMSQQLDPDLDQLISAYAEPFASASALGMLRVSQAVCSSAKVLLTGDGGDDVFLGYPRHRHLWLAEKMARRMPAGLKAGWRTTRGLIPRVGPIRRAAALLDYSNGEIDAFFSPGSGASNGLDGILGDRLSSTTLSDFQFDRDDPSRYLQTFLNYERSHRFVGEYLTKVDGSTMYYGLEARSPFLDQRIWEFASSLPFDLRLHRGRLKAILRELASRKIGSKLANRRKRGFGVPVQRWVTGRWRRWVDAAFENSVLDREGWIKSAAVLSQLQSCARQGWAPQQLWYVFVLESWFKHENAGAENAMQTESSLETLPVGSNSASEAMT